MRLSGCLVELSLARLSGVERRQPHSVEWRLSGDERHQPHSLVAGKSIISLIRWWPQVEQSAVSFSSLNGEGASVEPQQPQ